MNSTPVLNIVGTGKLGGVLGKLLADSEQVRIGSLFSRDSAKAQQAAHFLGAGDAISQLDALRDANFWMLSVSDDAIQSVATRLSSLKHNWQNAIVFHCSGINSSALLSPLAQQGAQVASVHPAHSFARPEESLRNFAGTFCAIEGTRRARQHLEPLFENIGARIISLDQRLKPLYHAAMTVASNHLVALLDSSLALLRGAGIEDQTARAIIEPLVAQSTRNFFTVGAEKALTGPAARGDYGTIEQHLAVITERAPEQLRSYLALLAGTLKIATSSEANNGHGEIAQLLAEATEQATTRGL